MKAMISLMCRDRGGAVVGPKTRRDRGVQYPVTFRRPQIMTATANPSGPAR